MSSYFGQKSTQATLGHTFDIAEICRIRRRRPSRTFQNDSGIRASDDLMFDVLRADEQPFHWLLVLNSTKSVQYNYCIDYSGLDFLQRNPVSRFRESVELGRDDSEGKWLES